MSGKNGIFDGGDEPSSEEEDPVNDNDVCPYEDISRQFSKRYVVSEEAVSLEKSYVLVLSGNREFRKIAACTSKKVVYIFDIGENWLSRTTEFLVEPEIRKEPICGVEFSKDTSDVLFVGTNGGHVMLYDLRINKRIHTFEGSIYKKEIPITCFDVNSNGRVLCAGSEQVANDVFMLFYDTRQRKYLGGYCESHHNDITDLKFHPTNPDLLMSGSTDGLINVFDISKSDEDDALSTVINSESSAHKLQWHKRLHSKDAISCITHTHDLKLYESEGDIISEFTRSDITSAIKRESVADCNLINCHDSNDSTFLLAGSNFNKGEILRSVTIGDNGIKPHANFDGNKQIVRSSVYNAESNVLITGGESAIITLWSGCEMQSLPSQRLKVKSKLSEKSRNMKPY